MKILLIRHGKTKGNTEYRYIGTTEESILPEWSKLLSKSYVKADYVFVSPRLRCRETAACLFPEKEQIVMEALSECDFGQFEGMNYQELNGNVDYQAYIDSGGLIGFPGGEDKETFQKRCVAGFFQAIARVKKEDCTIAFVVHGGTIMALMEYLVGPVGSYFDWNAKNGRGYELDCKETQDGIRVNTFREWSAV